MTLIAIVGLLALSQSARAQLASSFSDCVDGSLNCDSRLGSMEMDSCCAADFPDCSDECNALYPTPTAERPAGYCNNLCKTCFENCSAVGNTASDCGAKCNTSVRECVAGCNYVYGRPVLCDEVCGIALPEPFRYQDKLFSSLHAACDACMRDLTAASMDKGVECQVTNRSVIHFGQTTETTPSLTFHQESCAPPTPPPYTPDSPTPPTTCIKAINQGGLGCRETTKSKWYTLQGCAIGIGCCDVGSVGYNSITKTCMVSGNAGDGAY